jgi:hypothetical protein
MLQQSSLDVNGAKQAPLLENEKVVRAAGSTYSRSTMTPSRRPNQIVGRRTVNRSVISSDRDILPDKILPDRKPLAFRSRWKAVPKVYNPERARDAKATSHRQAKKGRTQSASGTGNLRQIGLSFATKIFKILLNSKN